MSHSNAHRLSQITDKLLAITLPPLSNRAEFYYGLLIVILVGLGLALAWLPLREIVLFIGGAIFLTVVLLKPILSLYLLIPVIPFSSLLAVSFGSFRAGLMEIVLFVGLMAWLLQILAGQNSSRTIRDLKLATVPLLWPFLLFLSGVAMSWLTTLSIGSSLIETIKWLEMLALYLFVVALLPVHQVKWVVFTLLLAGMAQAVLGLYQFIFKVGPEGFLLFDGRFLRAYGTFAQPNPYAGYLGLVLPLALALAMWGVGSARIWWSLPFGLLLAALFATQSRGAWLGFAIAAVVTLVVYSKKAAISMAMVALVGATISLAGSFDWGVVQVNTSNAVIQRLGEALSTATLSDISTIEVTDANFSTIERLAHWQAAREMWRDHLWLGVGFGNYAVIYPAYAPGRWLDPLGHAHNYLLNIGAEAGLVGLITYLILWLFAFRITWLAVRRSFGFHKAVAAGGLGILIHLHTHNLFDNLYVQGMYLHIAIILALIQLSLTNNGDSWVNVRKYYQFLSKPS